MHARRVLDDRGRDMLDSSMESTTPAAKPRVDNQITNLDGRLREYARRRNELDAAEAFDLVQAEELKVYAFVGCATHLEYMERRLGYAPHTARERMRVARSLASLPRTTTEIAQGKRGYAVARALTRVVTSTTEDVWLARTRGMTARQVEELVAGHRRGELPDDPTHPDLRPKVIRLELPPDVLALLRQARSVLADERGGDVDDADLIETMCRRILDRGTGAAGPAHQIAYKQCPDCGRATQNGAGREIDVAPEVFERAACDARDLGSLDAASPERATTTVTPRVREQVFARDHHRCTVPGCRSARNLDVHHIVEHSRGGSHQLWNVTLCCSGHHAALHAGLLEITGRAPYELRVRWRAGARPLPPGLNPDERAAMIEARIAEILAATSIATRPAGCEPSHQDAERRPTGTRYASDADAGIT
jgi:hypothetical protein